MDTITTITDLTSDAFIHSIIEDIKDGTLTHITVKYQFVDTLHRLMSLALFSRLRTLPLQDGACLAYDVDLNHVILTDEGGHLIYSDTLKAGSVLLTRDQMKLLLKCREAFNEAGLCDLQAVSFEPDGEGGMAVEVTRQ